MSNTAHLPNQYLSIRFHTFPYVSIPFHTFPYLCIPFSNVFHTFPYLSVPFHTFPYLSVPFHTFPYVSIPFHTFPYLSIPFSNALICFVLILDACWGYLVTYQNRLCLHLNSLVHAGTRDYFDHFLKSFYWNSCCLFVIRF